MRGIVWPFVQDVNGNEETTMLLLILHIVVCITKWYPFGGGVLFGENVGWGVGGGWDGGTVGRF